MTPAARVQAAIEILDRILAGDAAEKALTGWARQSRFAGSKDRAAVRDHVFDTLRHLRSDAARGGAMAGRGLMLGAQRRNDTDPEGVFDGAGYGPVPLTEDERLAGHVPENTAEALDIPDWLWPQFSASLGDQAEVAAKALQSRAPVYLRVNAAKADRDSAILALAQDEVVCTPHQGAAMALLVTAGSRRIRHSVAYRDGLVELQDVASQAVVEALPLKDGMRVLDYCAGGGGKALAMAARAQIDLFVHDADPGRMRDLPDRTARAGVQATQIETSEVQRHGPFDLVLCDVPCSGSGAWRRAPEGKWRLTREKLVELTVTQADILDKAADLTAPQGVLAYATCSLLAVENAGQIAQFLQGHPGWQAPWDRAWVVQDGSDGFYTAHLTRDDKGD